MAKFATTFFAFVFATLLLFAVFEAPVAVEAQIPKYCEKPSGTWAGVCGNNGACSNQCIKLERAAHGSCKYHFPAHRCICYYTC